MIVAKKAAALPIDESDNSKGKPRVVLLGRLVDAAVVVMLFVIAVGGMDRDGVNRGRGWLGGIPARPFMALHGPRLLRGRRPRRPACAVLVEWRCGVTGLRNGYE